MKAIVIWIAALALAALSASQTLSAYAERQMPQIAAKLPPANGRALAALTETEYRLAVLDSGTVDFSVPPPKGTIERTRSAIAREPLLPSAMRLHALSLASRGDDAAAQSLMNLIPAISKRDHPTSLWLILDYGRQENLPEMLKYMDIMLRSSSSATEVILPALAAQMTQDQILPPLAGMLKTNPPWAGAFWRAMIKEPSALPNTAKLWLMVGNPEPEISSFERSFIAVLAGQRLYPEAILVRDSVLPEPEAGNANVLFNGNFDSSAKVPPLDWVLTSDENVDAWIDQSEQALFVQASGSERALAARQLFIAETGEYELTAEFIQSDQQGTLDIELRCISGVADAVSAEPTRQIGTVLTQKISLDSARCPIIWLELYSRPDDAASTGVSKISFRKL